MFSLPISALWGYWVQKISRKSNLSLCISIAPGHCEYSPSVRNFEGYCVKSSELCVIWMLIIAITSCCWTQDIWGQCHEVFSVKKKWKMLDKSEEQPSSSWAVWGGHLLELHNKRSSFHVPLVELWPKGAINPVLQMWAWLGSKVSQMELHLLPMQSSVLL